VTEFSADKPSNLTGLNHWTELTQLKTLDQWSKGKAYESSDSTSGWHRETGFKRSLFLQQCPKRQSVLLPQLKL